MKRLVLLALLAACEQPRTQLMVGVVVLVHRRTSVYRGPPSTSITAPVVYDDASLAR